MNVARINPFMRQIHTPAPLHDIPAWLVWRYQEVPGSDKPGKVPYWANGTIRHGRQGDPQDLDNLRTFAQARDAAASKAFDGVGFAVLAQWGLTFIDIDNCVDSRGKIVDEVTDLIAGTYAEYSPSGRGIRAVFRGDLGNRKSAANADYNYGFETFSSSGFVTMTGEMLPHIEILDLDNAIAPVPDKLRAYCEARFKGSAPGHDPDDFMAGYEPRLGLSETKMREILSHIDPDVGRDEWIKVGMALHHECEGDDTGFDLWNDWSANGSKYPGEESLRVQWDSFTRRAGPGRKQTTMATTIWLAKQNGYDATRPVKAEELQAPLGPQTGFTPEDYDGRFPIVAGAAAANRPTTRWFIKGCLPDADMGIIYGPSGSGKSFVALDVAAALARGIFWRGRRTRQARVLVIAAEGTGGVSGRIRAYCRHHGITVDEFGVSIMYAAPNFLDQEDITDVYSALRAAGGFDLVIVDTFAQVTPGANENASEDMGRALTNVRALREASGAMIILIHHAGKDATRGSRGWSGLKAAADFQWEIIRHEDGTREIHVEKLKDGEDGVRWGFTLERVTLGLDEDGDEITSCVLIEAEVKQVVAPEADRKAIKRRNKMAMHILEIMQTFPPETETVPFERMVSVAADALPTQAGLRDTRRQQVTRALKDLAKEKDGPLYIDNGLVIFCE